MTAEDLLSLVRAYYDMPDPEGFPNSAGGSLHIVLEDGNTDRDSVESCKGYAAENDDPAGVFLATAILLLPDEEIERLYELNRSSIAVN